jgi:hypothetical protein
MQVHKNANGKTACRIDVSKKQVEVSDRKYTVLVQFNDDGTADAINFDLNGKHKVYRYRKENS